jgi:hypothetical protein
MTTQRDLLSRLPGVEFLVLAPAAGQVGRALAAPLIEPAIHREWLAQVARLRASAGMADADGSGDDHDIASWHVLAVRADDRGLVGAIRTRVYDLRDGHPPAATLFGYSGVHIADPSTARLIERALAEYIADQAGQCWRFHQTGGFAVAPALRGTALGPVLALAVNTLVSLLGLRGGCTFATLAHNVAALDRRFGAAGLHYGGRELPPFYCTGHRSFGQLLATEAGRFEPRLAGTAAALEARLRVSSVVAPR